MADSPPLPMVCEQDARFTHEDELHSQHPVDQKSTVSGDELKNERSEVELLQCSTQKAIETENELKNGGSNVDSLQSSPQKAIESANEMENGGSKVDSLQSSPQKAIMPKNKSDNEHSQSKPSSDMPNYPVIPNKTTRSGTKYQNNTVGRGRPRSNTSRAKAGGHEEQQASVEDRLRRCRNELETTKKELAQAKKPQERIKNQLEGRVKELNAYKQDLKDSNHSNIDLKRTIAELRTDLKACQEDLSKCRDDLISLQEVAQIPDSIISSQFECIGQQVAHWVDGQIAAFEKTHPETEPDDSSFASEEKIVANFTRRYPTAGDHLARNLIHRLLYLHLFQGKRYLIGMPEGTERLLQEVEHEMARLDPPRDSVAVSAWRSETLKSFAETNKYRSCCKQASEELGSHLLKELHYVFPALPSSLQTYDTLSEQILLPAIKFANVIRKSTSEYRISIPEAYTIKSKSVTKESLKSRKMIDVKSGKHLKPDSAVIADEDGIIGSLIICLEPALYRVMNGKERLLLKGTFLVELNSPLPKRIKLST